jgi:hypothetical protein
MLSPPLRADGRPHTLASVRVPNMFVGQIERMLEVAPCPVSETLLLHRAEVDDNIETAANLDSIREALNELVAAKKAVHVRRDELATRWPPAVFARYKESDRDDAVQLAIGAWASTANCERFDTEVREAHLPRHKRTVPPYLDIGWWGHLEPSADFVGQAELSTKSY